MSSEHLTTGLFVHPGQVVASATSCQYTTILGTCVSVCLFDPVAAVGGLNHFLLPYGAGASFTGTRYGNLATEHLLREVLALGALRERLQAKVFGGMTSSQHKDPSRDLGASNVAFALQWLEEKGIPILARDTGGQHGRKLHFHSQNGSAWVKHL
ncbi:chemotaxis protein CheD [Archangium sp.]|uniref:chemotaxis protein CheD n=1 Tax=Archangium sp. TaxID=1872627 RepID=UPI002D5B260F|nr:chemotaxis protein CheD [Archangium sp.]HYO60129.1 chemotaxis protein CheD [Archangium sp.]